MDGAQKRSCPLFHAPTHSPHTNFKLGLRCHFTSPPAAPPHSRHNSQAIGSRCEPPDRLLSPSAVSPMSRLSPMSESCCCGCGRTVERGRRAHVCIVSGKSLFAGFCHSPQRRKDRMCMLGRYCSFPTHCYASAPHSLNVIQVRTAL